MSDTVSTYQFVGGPYDGEYMEIQGTPLVLRFPVVSKIQLCTIVCSALPVTAPRDVVHEYHVEVKRHNKVPEYQYVYRGIVEVTR